MNDKIQAQIKALKGHGMTTTDIASAIGVSSQTIWNWERGNAVPRAEKAVSFALNVIKEKFRQGKEWPQKYAD